jgi:hydroxymethylglutaryl-CoA lyase
MRSRAELIYPAANVTLREVGLRDGLQLVKQFPSTSAKAEWLRRETKAGVKHFEIGSFLPANRVPQFADILELIDLCAGLDVHSAALALNDRGAENAVQTRVGEIVNVVSATEEHSQANMRRSRKEAVSLVANTVRLAADTPHRPLVQAGIAMAFGCSISGAVAADEVVRLSVACAEAGADLIGLADTVGFAGPNQVNELTARVQQEVGNIPVSVHLHDTRGMGIANASAALDAGARILDGSLGGLGGCPFAPGASGNVVFEDLVFLCERKGFPTGIDLGNLVAVRETATTEMPGEPIFGALARAGPPPLMKWRAERQITE